MPMTADQTQPQTATLVDLGAIFVSLELSKSTWLVTALSPGSEKMSRYTITGGDISGLFLCFGELREKAKRRKNTLYPVVVIQEAGLDGFWLGRVLSKEAWIESHIVEAASIAMPRRHRRAKTDRIDGETLIRALIAWKRGEPRACSMVKLLTPEEATALLGIKGIGPEFATILYTEGLFRHFDNRRQIASYAGLAPSPWQSGNVNREQGVSKAGNPRLRATMVELAWLWLRHQPKSMLTLWFKDRIARNAGRLKTPMIVALARKLLVALWKYVTSGVVIEGAIMKPA